MVSINQNDGFIQIVATGGQTDLDFDFPIYEKSHLRIIRTRSGTDTTLALNTNYTIADDQLEDASGGTAVLTSGATNGDIYTMLLDVPESRTTDYNEAGDFKAETLNRELDLFTQQNQQLRRDLDRSARLPDSSSISSLTLPTPTASNLLRWNASANGLENVAAADISDSTIVSSFIETLLDDTDAATARSTLGLAALAVLSTVGTSQIDNLSVTLGKLATDIFNSLTLVTAVSTDHVVIADASDSGNTKKALVSDIGARFKVGSFTRDVSLAGSTQAVTGVGFQPKLVIFFAGINATKAASFGFATGSSARFSLAQIGYTGADTWAVSASFVVNLETSASVQGLADFTSMDSDGFTVTWSKAGSPTGTATVGYIAIG
jgi:hypothetical protein